MSGFPFIHGVLRPPKTTIKARQGNGTFGNAPWLECAAYPLHGIGFRHRNGTFLRLSGGYPARGPFSAAGVPDRRRGDLPGDACPGGDGGAHAGGRVLRSLCEPLPGALPGLSHRLDLRLLDDDGVPGRRDRVRRLHGPVVSRCAALDLGAGHRVVHFGLEPLQRADLRRAGVLVVAAQGAGDPGDDSGRSGRAAVRYSAG
ncbi:hypothetical protein D3C85_778080 [compost metagenome]